jgi:hypothetical protein
MFRRDKRRSRFHTVCLSFAHPALPIVEGDVIGVIDGRRVTKSNRLVSRALLT